MESHIEGYMKVKELHNKIVKAIEEGRLNVDPLPADEDFKLEYITGVLVKHGNCLYIEDHLIMIQAEDLSFTDEPLALKDENKQISFQVGDKVTLGGFSGLYSGLMDNDIGSYSEFKNPYLYECEAEKIWYTMEVV